VLAASQQLANALGVALIGLVFFGALGRGAERAAYAGAFGLSLSCLTALALVLAILVWRLERRA
jgi:hypothetical protein